MKYPVDMNARYIPATISTGAIWVNPETGEPTKPRKWPQANGMPIPKLDADLAILKLVDGVKPAFDPESHKLESAMVVDIPAEEYRREYTAVQLTQQEYDDLQEQSELAAEEEQARAMYLLLKDGNANNNQVQKTLAHLLKIRYRP